MAQATLGGGEDVNSAVGTQEYSYDRNGNMVTDTNKGITEIKYNYLNLPEQVTIDNTVIEYIYDAAGIKHAKTVDDGSPETTTYVGGFHYTNNDLKFLQHTEGRALKDGSTWNYEYNLTDHLGNVRVTVDESGNVVQRDGYYPFGGTFNSSATSPENLYKYNGQELQSETGWYDYGARMQDPWLGRFFTHDRFAEKYYSLNPYQYGANNPILYIDVNGDSLVLNFENIAALSAFITETDNALGGQFSVSLTSVGGGDFNVGLTATEGGGDVEQLSEGSKAFYSGLKGVIDHKKVTRVDVLHDSEDSSVGNYRENTIDMGDIQAFPKFDASRDSQTGATGAGKLMHEIREQFGKALDGRKPGDEKGYASNHIRAIDWENDVNGNTRSKNDSGNVRNGVIQSYTRPDGSVSKYKINGVGKERRIKVKRVQ